MMQARFATGTVPPPPPTPAALQAALAQLRGGGQRLLRGVQLGLVGHDGRAARTRTLVQAALDLGARVSLLEPGALTAGQADADAARLLGRLYDGIDCDSGDAAWLSWLAKQSGLPVTSFVTPGSASAQLLARLEATPEAAALAAAERPMRLLQAGLLAAMGARRA
jgi:ornithine carbamoyltransferase